MTNYINPGSRSGREFRPAEGWPLWCRIEDLGSACGYDAAEQFSLLAGLPDAYPARPGRDPEDLAEEHPMQALACLVRRFLAEYPEEAARLAAAQEGRRSRRPGRAA